MIVLIRLFVDKVHTTGTCLQCIQINNYNKLIKYSLI